MEETEVIEKKTFGTRWNSLSTKERIFWVAIYIFVIAVILFLAAWLGQIATEFLLVKLR